LSTVFQTDPKNHRKDENRPACSLLSDATLNPGAATDDNKDKAVPAGKKIAQL
jgi:hypothetical protein